VARGDFMLLKFRVNNYKSIGTEVVLDMNAVNKLTDNKHFLIESEGGNVLPVAALFGLNAGGKTNILDAFYAMKKNIFYSTLLDKNENLLTTPFLFNEEMSNQPTAFEIFFMVNDKEYNYCYIITKAEVIEEWLSVRKFSKNDTKWTPIFKREGSKIIHSKYESLKEYNHLINNKMLVLSFFYGKELKSIYEFEEANDWFRNHWFSDNTMDFYNDSLQFYYEDDKLRKALVKFLQKFDIDIEDIIIEREEDKDGNKKYKPYTRHNGNKYSAYIESHGTKKLFWLYLIIKFALDFGGVAIVDELDCQLHPFVLRKIIRMFHNKDVNSKNAQIVFTSHNLIILDRRELRRDEIWFVEKNENKYTELFSLAEFKTDDKQYRADSDYGKHYLAGRFGAIPNLDKEV